MAGDETFAYTRTILDMVHQPMVVLDPELRVRHANPAFADVDARVLETAAVRGELARVLAGGELLRAYEVVYGERTYCIDARVLPAGMPGLLVAIDDVTERRRLEEANKELDSFTYSVSHDLRAPLRAIDGFSRILVEDYGPTMTPDELRLANVIRKNTVQMGQLIDDLLAFARLGRKELTMSHVDMKALLVELVPEVLAGTEDRRIDLKAGFVPPCTGDRALLKQVWLNLCSNAVKYTRKRERALISISGEVTETEIVYKVEDNGAGFDMQYVHKLFGVFQRLHRTTEFEGTGVGLALVQRIVRRHGGRVWAEGRPNEGATFWFALPRRS